MAGEIDLIWHAHLRRWQLEAVSTLGRTNDAVLKDIAWAGGFRATLHQVHQDLVWLQEHGLVVLAFADDLVIVDITRSGQEVASGLVSVPGLAPARPID